MKPTRVRTGIALLLIPLLLSACSAASTREAAPDSPAASDDGALVQASNLGVRICMVNKSAVDLRGRFTKYTRADQAWDLEPDEALCGEGSTTVDSDVVAEVTGGPRDSIRLTIEGDNPWMGKPYTSIYTPFSGKWPGKIKVGDLCLGNSGMAEGESRSWDIGLVKGTVTRNNDSSGFKEFTLMFEDSSKPAPDFRYQCSAGDYP